MDCFPQSISLRYAKSSHERQDAANLIRSRGGGVGHQAMMTDPRRYPISPADNVRHMDGRAGKVEDLCRTADGLPGAMVRFGDKREICALGFLQRVGSLEVD